MKNDIGAMKKNPGFIAFWGSNVKPTNPADTQLVDAQKDKMQAVADQKPQLTNGGEGGKA